jgi:phospholipid/cholesterol/gamma-HCH transport system substrate-binding protein
MMKYFTKEVKIALTAIVAIALLFIGINFLKGVNLFKTSNRYHVVFTNINGLTVSTPVYANGYPVGIVRDITYDYKNTGQVNVDIELDKEMRLPEGSKAELESDMLGSVKVNLILGKNPLKYVEPGDTLQGSMYYGALNKMEAMIPTLERALPKLDSILGSLNKLLADPALAATLKNTEELTAELKTGAKQMNRLLAKDVPELTGRMNQIATNVETVTGQMARLDVVKTMGHVDTTLSNLQEMSLLFNTKLRSRDNSLGLLLNDTRIYENLNHTMMSADSLLMDLKAHPKRYVHFSIFGKKDK